MNNEAYHFERWSTDHIAALSITLLITALTLFLITLFKEQGRTRIGRFLAGIIALQFISEYVWRFVSGDYGSWQYNLPLHFCSFMSVLSFIALWWKWRPACALVYFGVLMGSIQGLITPAMADGRLAYYVFFTAHGLLLLVALSIPLVTGWRARGYDDLKALLLMDAYLLLIIPINILLGTNYAYTQAVPIKGTLLDVFGTAPWYYLWAQLPVLAVFRLLMFPVHDKAES